MGGEAAGEGEGGYCGQAGWEEDYVRLRLPRASMADEEILARQHRKTPTPSIPSSSFPTIIPTIWVLREIGFFVFVAAGVYLSVKRIEERHHVGRLEVDPCLPTTGPENIEVSKLGAPVRGRLHTALSHCCPFRVLAGRSKRRCMLGSCSEELGPVNHGNKLR